MPHFASREVRDTFGGMRACVALMPLALFVGLAGGVLLAAPVRAEEDLPVPAPPKGDILRIPGLPPVELPPGAKVFGPRGPELGGPPNAPPSKPSVRGETPQPSTGPTGRDSEQAGDGSREKAAPPKLSQEAQRTHVLDELFKQLAASGDADEAKNIAQAIQVVWLRSGSDTADLLMTRAVAAMTAGQTALAIELLDHVVEIAPSWAEGWNKRATARFLADDYDGSMSDIDRTLVLEPRHFGALGGLATIMQRSGSDKRALEVLRRVLAIYPQQPEIRKLVDKMSLEVDGRDI